MTIQSTRSTVVIAGGGIVGPVLALFLQQKGYRPVVVDKVREISEAGIALGPSPNGLKVLNKVGLAEELLEDTPPWERWREWASSGETLGQIDTLKSFIEKYGWPVTGCSRTKLQQTLIKALRNAGIELHEGWKLTEIRETDDGTGVVARSEEGREITCSFLVGCDGLRSTCREILSKKKGLTSTPASYTGCLLQGGLSPTPKDLQASPGMDIIYGPGSTMLTYAIENGLSNWAFYSPKEQKLVETWRRLNSEDLSKQKEHLIQKLQSENWPECVIQLIAGALKMVQNGLYDRLVPPPEQWFHGRCMLLGDAAHPTSPHLGQGANQGLEDCWHLSQLLPDFDPSDPSAPSTEVLTEIFHTVAKKRRPRVEALVKGARGHGDLRIVEGGPEVFAARNDKIRMAWQDPAAVLARFDNMYNEPFIERG